jgi:hypothetical protein
MPDQIHTTRFALAALTAAALRVRDADPGAEPWDLLCEAIDDAVKVLDPAELERANAALDSIEAEKAHDRALAQSEDH